MKVLDGTGHTATPYDTADPKVMADVNAEFDRLVAARAMVFDTADPKAPRQIDDPTREVFETTDTVFVVPQFMGG